MKKVCLGIGFLKLNLLMVAINMSDAEKFEICCSFSNKQISNVFYSWDRQKDESKISMFNYLISCGIKPDVALGVILYREHKEMRAR